MRGYRAVFFDAGETLFHPYPSAGHIYSEIGRRYGLSLSAGEINDSFAAVWQKKDRLIHTSQAKDEKGWWKEIVENIFSPFGRIEDFDRFFEELYIGFAEPRRWRVYSDVWDVLEGLKKKGMRLCIVSNWDQRLLGLCRDFDLNSYFDAIVISSVVGFAKPDRRIFEKALDVVSMDAKEVLYVGDSFRDDVEGARNAGLVPVYLNRKGRVEPGVWSIKTLKALLKE